MIKFTISILSITLIAIIGSLAPSIHDKYLTNTVGSNVFKVVSPTNTGSGGTGFLVTTDNDNTYILTNAHVCELNYHNYMLVSIPGTTRYMEAAIIEQRYAVDLCLIKSPVRRTGINLAYSVERGESIYIVGHPGLEPLTVSQGLAGDKLSIPMLYLPNATQERCAREDMQYVPTPPVVSILFGVDSFCYASIKAQYSMAHAYPGNSGSPVVDYWGHLIGVLFAGNGMTNYGYVIPLESIRAFLESY